MVDPKSIYFIENNSLILSIFCKNHLENLNSLKLSSSQIRTFIKQQKSIKYMVPEVVERMIKEMGFYR